MECDEKSEGSRHHCKNVRLFYEYEVVTTTCVAAGVFTTMCGVHSGVNLYLKDDLIKGYCISPKTKIFPELLHYSPVVLNNLSASTNIL